ncbi:MAG: winged helix-turn-helix domain-containing protein [Terriglobia bacterium]
MPATIVVIEDEKDILSLLAYTLRKEGFLVKCSGRGQEGLNLLRRGPADLALIDIMLPDLDGIEICKRLRRDRELRNLPVIFLTAKGEEIDRVLGLEIGADDYVVKPFSPRELVARIKAVLRRRDPVEERPLVIESSELRMDARTQEVLIRGRAVELSALEFKLLHFLASHPRHIFPRERLLDEVWGPDRFVTRRTVDVHIRRLREKIEAQPESPHYLQTVRGSGYRFTAELPEDPAP